MKIVKLEKTKLLRAVIYGDSGVGKTHLLGTAMLDERTCPMLVLDAQGQPVTFTLLAEDKQPLVLEMEGTGDINWPYAWLARGQPRTGPNTGTKLAKYVFGWLDDRGYEKFKTFAVDSITHVQYLQTTEISDVGMPGTIPRAMQIQEWGSIFRQWANISNRLYKLPLHVVLTALTKYRSLEDSGRTLFTIGLDGKGAQVVPSHATLVGRLIALGSMTTRQATTMEKEDPEAWAGARNVLLVRGGKNYYAKWQGVEGAGDVVVAPTITKLLDIGGME